MKELYEIPLEKFIECLKDPYFVSAENIIVEWCEIKVERVSQQWTHFAPIFPCNHQNKHTIELKTGIISCAECRYVLNKSNL